MSVLSVRVKNFQETQLSFSGLDTGDELKADEFKGSISVLCNATQKARVYQVKITNNQVTVRRSGFWGWVSYHVSSLFSDKPYIADSAKQFSAKILAFRQCVADHKSKTASEQVHVSSSLPCRLPSTQRQAEQRSHPILRARSMHHVNWALQRNLATLRRNEDMVNTNAVPVIKDQQTLNKVIGENQVG